MNLNPFVNSKAFLRILLYSLEVKEKINDILNIKDEYEAFCINEASSIYLKYLKEGKKPNENNIDKLKGLGLNVKEG